MARGLGAFLEGLGDGYQQGVRNNMALEQADREKKRFALEEARAGREAEQFGLTKELTQQQIATGKLDLEKRQKEAEYEKELASQLQSLIQQSRGGVEGEVIDTSGNAVGTKRFMDLSEAQKELQANGLTFRPGSVKELPKINQADLELQAADILMAHSFKTGKVSVEMLDAAKKRRKDGEREGAIEAMRYFYATGDEKGAKEMFNKNGKIKLGDDVKLGMKDGMFGPTLVGYKVGKDGKQQEVFEGFRDLILPSMSPEAYANTLAQFKVKEVDEKGQNVRLGATLENQRQIAAMNNNTELAKAANAGGKEDRKALYEIHKTRFSGIFRNPQDVLEADRQKTIEGRILAVAEQYLDTGKVGVGQAYDLAQRQVFRDFKVGANELAK